MRRRVWSKVLNCYPVDTLHNTCFTNLAVRCDRKVNFKTVQTLCLGTMTRSVRSDFVSPLLFTSRIAYRCTRQDYILQRYAGDTSCVKAHFATNASSPGVKHCCGLKRNRHLGETPSGRRCYIDSTLLAKVPSTAMPKGDSSPEEKRDQRSGPTRRAQKVGKHLIQPASAAGGLIVC